MSDDNDDKERKGGAPKTGKLIPKGATLPPARVTGEHRTLYRLFARLSTLPFFNRKYVKSLKTAKEVYDAKSDLGEAIGRHGEIRERLKDFGTVLERGREERSRQLFEERERRRAAENTYNLESKMQKERNRQVEEALEIEGMKIKKENMELQQKLDELKTPPTAPEPPKKKRAVDPIHSKVKDEVKRAKTESKVEKDIEGLSEAAKKRIRKKLRIDQEIHREEEGR